ncbi:MAG: regulatory protein RecX [Dehalococcoidia bacterium]
MIVTAVERKPRGRKVDVYVDGELALSMSRELASERDMRPGRTLILAELISIREEESRRGAKEAALRLLSHRPRSERELSQRLFRKGFSSRAVETTVDRMRELGYLDDAAFARFWAEARQASHPSSQRMLQIELRRRGIESETAQEATADVSDDEAALEAARRRVRSLAGLEYQAFRERLGAFLTRRGFSYSVARRVIDECWSEQGGSSDEGAH